MRGKYSKEKTRNIGKNMTYEVEHKQTIDKLLSTRRAIGDKEVEQLREALTELRITVENIDHSALALRGGIYKELKPHTVYTLNIDNCQIGLQVTDHKLFMRRRIFIKWPGHKLEEIPPGQQEPYMVTAMNVLLDRGQSIPEIDVNELGDCYIITQDFMPLILHREGTIGGPSIKIGEPH